MFAQTSDYYLSQWGWINGKCRRLSQEYLGKPEDIAQALQGTGPAPAYAVVLATLVALLLPPPPPDRGLRHVLRLAPALAGLLAAGWLAIAGLADLRQMDDPETLPEASIPDLQRALVWAPTSWHAWYYLGIAVAHDGVEHSKPRRCLLGGRLAAEAARCDPQNYRLWYQLGELRLALLDYNGADAAFARAQALRPWLHPPPSDRPKGPQ